MAYEHKPGSFSLFKNDKKGNDRAPDYKGDGKDANGSDIEVAAWIKEGKKGKFMSCTFKPKQERQKEPESRPYQEEPGRSKPIQTASNFSDMDDDIPF